MCDIERYGITTKVLLIDKLVVGNGGDIMSYFPVNDDEISLIKFIAKYQYLNVRDAKYFFNSSRYYRNRIKDLIDKNFLRKIKWSLALGKSGIKYAQALNFVVLSWKSY